MIASYPDVGVINYLSLEERNKDPTDLVASGGWLKLIDQLKYPTYTAYDFANKYLYVCDCDEILQFKIDFAATIEAEKNGAVATNVSCGGLAVDKFSNLFYVDTRERSQGSSFSSIMRINRDLL